MSIFEQTIFLYFSSRFPLFLSPRAHPFPPFRLGRVGEKWGGNEGGRESEVKSIYRYMLAFHFMSCSGSNVMKYNPEVWTIFNMLNIQIVSTSVTNKYVIEVHRVYKQSVSKVNTDRQRRDKNTNLF